mmetsp:Transcript_7074/g.8025  ORF Transcript_7074/g.8025 Transcript_7074/m.8025 type:complete len:98 (+) Transcript_7074:275-568(+)
MLANYYVCFILLILLVVGHLWIKLLNLELKNKKSFCKDYIGKIAFTFDHGFYVKLLTSMAFMTAFTCTSEITGYYSQNGYNLNVVGSYLSLGFCVFF